MGGRPARSRLRGSADAKRPNNRAFALSSSAILKSSAMSSALDPQLRRALADRIRYYNDLGIYDFYKRQTADNTSENVTPVPSSATTTVEYQDRKSTRLNSSH